MADDDKGYGPWSKVPVWDGSPLTWRRFRRDVTWWLSSLELSKTTGYNLAARFLLRQQGIARQRGEEFLPEELTFGPAPRLVDPDTHEEIEDPDAEPDYLRGINKLMKAWEEMNGRTALDKRGELRQAFYMDLTRKATERVSEFCTRFRSLVADLKSEGVVLNDGELGWWLRQKLGLVPLRRQLLDTALQGSEDYSVIESEVLRLFRDLHENDPLFRKQQQQQQSGDRRPLSIRRMFPAKHPMSSAASTSSRMSSLASWSRPTSHRSSSQPARQANVTEQIDEYEEAMDGGDGGEAEEAPNPSLEEVLQAEAEVLAAELEEAELEGVDPIVLTEFEDGVERAAETLVTMREARHQLQNVRKDRGYGKANESTFRKSGSNAADAKKASGRHPCFDCLEHGHWSGDPQCKKPGAGLGRKKTDQGGPKKPMRQVRVTETDTSAGASSASPPVHSADVVEHAFSAHDVLMTDIGAAGVSETLVGEVFGSEALNLEQALMQSFSQGPNAAKPQPNLGLPEDKELVGALDSACNRTCAGPEWLNGYLDGLKEAPQDIQDLVEVQTECENFRFGNNGVVPSLQRWRLPAMVDKTLIMFWVSLVPVSTLGCLIGRDFLEAIGAILDFSQRTLTCAHIQSSLLQLRQMVAGHFMLELLPRHFEDWGAIPKSSGLRWRRCGQDGVLELLFSRMQWLHYRLKHSSVQSIQAEKEHLVVESSILACHFSYLKGITAVQATSTLPTPMWPRARASTCRSKSHSRRPHARKPRRKLQRGCGAKMASHGGSHSRSSLVAFPWHSALALAATWIAILAMPLSYGEVLQGLGIASGVYVFTEDLACKAFEVGFEGNDPGSSFRVSLLEGSSWIRAGVSGRSGDGQHLADPQHAWSESCDSQGGDVGSPERGPSSCSVRSARRCHQISHWTSWWIAVFERRLDKVSNIVASACGREGHCGDPEAEGAGSSGCCDGDSEEQGSEVEGIPGCRCHEVLAVQFAGGTSITRSSSAPTRRSSRIGRTCDAEFGETGEEVSGILSTDDGAHAVNAQGKGCNTASSPTRRGRGDESARADGRDELRRGSEIECRLLRGAPSRVDSHTRGRVRSEKPPGVGRSAVKDEIGCLVASKIKAGVRQMISQAWEKHCRDRVAMSEGKYEIYEVMESLYGQELREQMNEVFALEVDFPDPFITEVYTDTEPVAREARRRGLRTGQSLTLSTSWDFTNEEHRRSAKLLIEQTAPYVLVLAFPCGPWSLLMNLNAKVDVASIRAAARVLVVFAVELAWMQLRRGLHFILENPLTSMAWQLDEMQELLREPMVHRVVIDQCYFGLMNEYGELHRKSTQLVTFSQVLVSKMLGCRCQGGHTHAPVIGGAKVTRPAGHYPRALASAMVSAMQDQFNFETKSLYVLDEPYEAMAVEEVEEPNQAVESAAPWQSSDDEVVMDFVGEDSKMKISPGVRQMVFRLHENTGHRSGKRLARALMVCGAPKEAILAAKQLRCPVCAEQRAPRARRPATLPQTSQVGAKVHIDLLMLEDALRQSYVVVHVTDSVSRFQMAAVMNDKSSASVIQFLATHWMPLMGPPETLVADQGREFISQEFEDWTSSKSIFLYHVGVQCPWQNGVAERSGATLKALVGAIVRGQAIIGHEEMAMAVGEAVASYNSDVNEEGISPIQAVTGRQSAPPGDVLAGVSNRLAEHSLVDRGSLAAKQLASRELARLAMVRLHFSRGLRKAELARARSSTFKDLPQPGDLCYYWRETKYNPKKDRGVSRRKLILKRWHGPAMMVALEGQANCFLSHRGQLTKCGLEHVRKASSLEQISAEAWEEAIKEVIEAVPTPDVAEGGDGGPVMESAGFGEHERQLDDEVSPAVLPLAAPPSVPLTPGEMVAALQPSLPPPESRVGSTLPSFSRRSSKATVGISDAGEPMSTAAPGTPVGRLMSSIPASTLEPALLQQPLERARSLERSARGEKRPASQPLAEEEMARNRPEVAGSSSSTTPVVETPQQSFEAFVLSWDQLCNLASSTDDVHPLVRLQAQAELDKKDPLSFCEADHGSWDGRWSMLCEREWELQKELCQQLPCGCDVSEVLNVQASRKEYSWNKLSPEDRKLWADAAVKGWQVYIDNEAVQVLSIQRSQDVRRELAQQGRLGSILRPRFVLTDKADGLRTVDNNIPKQPSARLVVPGFRDAANLEGKLRRDAPTGSRLAQHLLFCLAYVGILGLF